VIGPILAVVLVLYALGFALFAYFAYRKLPDAAKTRAEREPDYITRDELKIALEHNAQEFEFMTNEWYEKFNALHQRLAKREKKALAPADPELDLAAKRPPSVRDHYLRRA